MKKKFKLKNVTYTYYTDFVIAYGDVYGNPKFDDGTRIFTSTIKFITDKPPAIHTQNSVYHIVKKDLPSTLAFWNTHFGRDLEAMYEAQKALGKVKKKVTKVKRLDKK